MLFYSFSLLIVSSLIAAVLGACMGSFINCLAWRMTHGESIMRGRSHCDFCSHTLGAADLIPIISYLFSGGRCRYCRAKLSASHIVIELLTAAAYVGVLLRFDITLKTVEGIMLTTILIAVSLTDIYDCIIPDGFIIAGVIIKLGFILASKNVIKSLVESAVGGFAVAGVLLVIVVIFEKIKGVEAMGGGDIKLLFMIGLFLGWQKNLMCVLAACVIGILFGMAALKGRDKSSDQGSGLFPWGPSIAVSAWLCYMFGDVFLDAYMSLF